MIKIRNYSLEFVPDENNNRPYPAAKKSSSSGFLNGLLRDRDTVLVLMLILLLYSDGCDRILIFALVYIIT